MEIDEICNPALHRRVVRPDDGLEVPPLYCRILYTMNTTFFKNKSGLRDAALKLT